MIFRSGKYRDGSQSTIVELPTKTICPFGGDSFIERLERRNFLFIAQIPRRRGGCHHQQDTGQHERSHAKRLTSPFALKASEALGIIRYRRGSTLMAMMATARFRFVSVAR